MGYYDRWAQYIADNCSEFQNRLIYDFNSQVSKKLTPQVSSWFSTTKGIESEEMTRFYAYLTSLGDSSCL